MYLKQIRGSKWKRRKGQSLRRVLGFRGRHKTGAREVNRRERHAAKQELRP